MARFSSKPQLQTLASSVIIPGTAPEGGAAVGGGTVSPGNDIRLTVGQLLATLGDAGASQATRVGSTAKWQAAKARGATNPARLAIVGDSNVAGQGSGTGADGLVGAATTSLARRFMAKKGVRTDSFFGEQNVTLANTGLASYDPRITLGTGWVPDATVSQIFGGRHMKAAGGSAGKLRFTPAGAFSSFRVWYPTLAGLNTAVGIYVDGSLVDTVSQDAAASLVSKDYTVSAGTHYIEVGVGSGGDAFVCGIETFDGSASPVALVGGYCAAKSADLIVASQPWNHRPMLSALRPDFTVVICTINDTTAGTDPGTWYANLEAVVKAASATSDGCLCVGFVPNDGKALGGIYGYDAKAAALRNIAADYNWHFLDLRVALGRSWARQSDRGLVFDNVHPNATGAEAIASALSDFLQL